MHVKTLFASPNCAPWGNNSRCLPRDVKQQKREEETFTLRFLAAACFLQHLLSRKYILENSAYSDIFHDSPLGFLREFEFDLALLDQCACGGMIEDQYIRRRTHFQSNSPLRYLNALCPGGHTHLYLRGGGRAATSAKYPEGECDRILKDAETPISNSVCSHSDSEGGSVPLSLLPESVPDHHSRQAWVKLSLQEN